MTLSVSPAAYWRISLIKRGTSYATNGIHLARLQLADANGSAIAHSALTNTGTQAVSGTLANIADSDNATTAYWIGAWASAFPGCLYGLVRVVYQFASPVLPQKLLVRQASGNMTYSATPYAPASPELLSAILECSTDGTNWTPVSYQPSIAPVLDTSYTVELGTPNWFYNSGLSKPLSGDGGIYGIVAEDGTPASRPVILYEREFFTPIRRTVSDSDGAYSFTNLNRDLQYMVLAVDTTEEPGQPGVYKNAIAKDRISPIPSYGLPSGGTAMFHRYRSTVVQPRAAWAFVGPGEHSGLYSGMPLLAARYGDGLIDTTAGGGYDLRGIPLPEDLGLRLIYTKSLAPPWTVGPALHTYTACSFELIAEVPSGADPEAIFTWAGPAVDNNTYYGRLNAGRFYYGPVIQITAGGVINARVPFSSSTTWNTVRCAGSATPGTIVHIVLTWSRDQNIRMYVNGALAQSTSVAGLGDLYQAHTDGGSFPTAPKTNVSQAIYNTITVLDSFRWHAGPGLALYNGSPANRVQTGVLYSAVYAQDLSLTPDASGTPIAIRDLYSTYANADTWQAGSRPNGWPAAPAFTGYGNEVCADGPQFWARMQETDQALPASAYGYLEGTGCYSATGVTLQSTGMTAGLNSVRFASDGVLRFCGTGFTNLHSNGNTYASNIRVNQAYAGTVECWYRPASLANASSTLVAVYSWGNTVVLSLSVNSSGKVVLVFVDASGTTQTITFSSASALQVGTAYHLAVVWDSISTNTVKLYIDGAEAASQSFFYVPSNAQLGHSLAIGNLVGNPTSWPYNGTASGATSFANGDIQDVAIYARALPAARIAAHYAARNV